MWPVRDVGWGRRAARVWADSGESAFAALLRAEGLEFEVKQLRTGDVMAFCRGRTWIFERKTIADFMSGYTELGGRWEAERARLAGEAQHSKAVTSDVLLIGPPPPNDGQSHGFGRGLTGHQFWAALADLRYNYGVGVWHFASELEAARFVARTVAARAGQGKFDEGVAVADRDAEPSPRDRKRARDESVDDLMAGLLARLRGMSEQKARALVDALQPRLTFHGATEAQIADVRVGKTRMGKALAATWVRLTQR